MDLQIRSVCIAVAAAILGTGCATDGAMREVAGSSAELVNEFKQASASFVVRMNTLNEVNTADLRRLAARTQAMQIRSASAATGWTAIADDDAVTMYTALTALQPADVIANSAVLTSLKPSAVTVPITADPKQFDSLVKKLNGLAAAPTFPELVQSWIAFGKGVNDTLKAEMKSSGDALQTLSK